MIGAVVVLFNPTKNEIGNINTYLSKVEYVVVVDNSAQNNEKQIDLLIIDKSKIVYYSERTNLGLCKAFNIGVDILKEKGCDWALLFDADSNLGSDIVRVYKKAIKEYEGKQVALFAPVHLFDRSNAMAYQGYKSVDWSMTSGWLINIDIFMEQHGFFEELFVDGLDMDYCFRVHENGYQVIECGEAVIKHYPAETKKFFCIKYGVASPYRYYMQAKQLIWCWRRYRKLKVLFIYLYKWVKVVFFFPMKKEYVQQMIKGSKEGFALWEREKRKRN